MELRTLVSSENVVEGTVADVSRTDWDAIVSVNVLEHIKEDSAELKSYARLLSLKRGTLNLFVPARPEIYSPIDRDFGHYRRYTKKELLSKLREAGLQVTRVRYFNWLGYFAWWYSFRLLKQRHFKSAQVKLYDRVIFPIVYAMESRLFSPPFGQSLIASAQPC